ncbi:hypothetical protein E1301_Tti001885 [Triplophysa tibetana]|uniref:Uncharacterized protein n=1 Tax=Triplophysa tibetana TaxID=1572043 RepID=A0A5A9PH78_9TELE|nr:hypothetical protein E1301_Tti001885 [Triplophysa tibetana]
MFSVASPSRRALRMAIYPVGLVTPFKSSSSFNFRDVGVVNGYSDELHLSNFGARVLFSCRYVLSFFKATKMAIFHRSLPSLAFMNE